MSLIAQLSKSLAKFSVMRISYWSLHAHKAQDRIFSSLISSAQNTVFGLEHDFKSIRSYDDFVQRVPVCDYESLRTYIDRVIAGEENILWPG